MVIRPGWFGRSPCGTGTSARTAQLHAHGELPLERDFVGESFLGSSFTGRLVAETSVGRAARGGPHDHRTGMAHRHRPVLPGPGRPVPPGGFLL